MIQSATGTRACAVPGCQRTGRVVRSYCRPHYRRWLRHGTPTGGGPGRCRGTVLDRLEKFRQRATGSACWAWTGSCNNKGYGVISLQRGGRSTPHLAHRLAWEAANGRPVPDGYLVLHSCDNPPCTNPAHLSVGNHSENTQQMWDRGRR